MATSANRMKRGVRIFRTDFKYEETREIICKRFAQIWELFWRAHFQSLLAWWLTAKLLQWYCPGDVRVSSCLVVATRRPGPKTRSSQKMQ